MNRNPVKGDIITIGKGQTELLVVHDEMATSHDALRGDSYWANVFDVVPTHVLGDTRAGVTRVVPDNAKVTRYMTDGCMNAGKKVDRGDIRLVGSCKFKAIVTTEYVIGKEKGV